MTDDPADMVRILRCALASIWTALETDGDPDDLICDAQTIADEGLKLSQSYHRGGKDLTDDTKGLESWRLKLGRFAEKSALKPPTTVDQPDRCGIPATLFGKPVVLDHDFVGSPFSLAPVPPWPDKIDLIIIGE